ncbi:ABC transporter ATP-binding protein [Salarchaeum sp. JOR-1]|uniref:ABC transporter ATP-binding protein n=1 Tax=Salarchaeum sp. JOR-1 TaxID=2599399 RepID=UPI0011985D79|nr:ABC transporter ATP-binding protein [Salarchaeum sp. JOR-1]QDX40190.1 ABC transporter ATP-binding protein [Salarchaeum sp. JOR-1]
MAAIELSGVRKDFGDVTALRGVDLEVEDGEVFGFLGPNGAGKSTTIDIILDFVRPTEGEARVLGRDAHDDSLSIRDDIGVLPEGFSVYDRLTGRQHVDFAIESKDTTDDPDDLLDRVGIDPADRDRKAGGYSKGMQQRLALSMALVGSPDLLLLDEPSTGLDPNGAREMRELILEEADRGATVFFSSHILEQVEAVCDRVGILRKGELVAEDTIRGLRDAVGTGTVLTVVVDEVTPDAMEAARAVDGVQEVSADRDTIRVRASSDAKTRVLDAVESAGVTVSDFATEEASLDEVFAAYTEDAR